MAADPTARPIALLTGGGGDMGRAIAMRLASEWTVVVTDRDSAAAAAVAGETDGGFALELDVADPGQIRSVAADCRRRIGPVRALVNAAGIEPPQQLEDLQPDDWDRTQHVNLRGPALLAQALVPHWREARSGGAIVTIGSRTWLGGPKPGYAASKAGVVGLSRSIAHELGPLGVTANVIAPSFVATGFGRQNGAGFDVTAHATRVREQTPLRREVTADDIAAAVAFLVSDGARCITGEVLHVCAGSQLTSFLR